MSLKIEETATGLLMTRGNKTNPDNAAAKEILTPEIQLPEDVIEDPGNEEGNSGVSEENQEDFDTSLDVSDDEGEMPETTEPEQAIHDMDVQGSGKVENASIDTAGIVFPPEVTPEPRNEEELHLDIFKDNPEGILTYLPVSDDVGEVLGDTELEQHVKTICQQYSNCTIHGEEELARVIEELKNLATKYTLTINSADNRLAGTVTKYRIREGGLYNLLKDFVKEQGFDWTKWFKKNFGTRSFRSVQDYMRLAKIPGIIAFAFLGKERLLEILRYLDAVSKDQDNLVGDEKDDPVGAFFKKYVVFNPGEVVDVQEIINKTDIAINQYKCQKAGLEIPIDKIEAYVLNGKDVTANVIDKLKTYQELGVELGEAFDKIIASDGKASPPQTPGRKAESFKKSTEEFIAKIDSAIKDHEYLGQFKMEFIARLREKLQELEQNFQANSAQNP